MRKVTHKTSRGYDAYVLNGNIFSDDPGLSGCENYSAKKHGYTYGYSTAGPDGAMKSLKVVKESKPSKAVPQERKVTHKTAKGFDACCDDHSIFSDDPRFDGTFTKIAKSNGYKYGYSVGRLAGYEENGEIIKINTKPSDEEIYHKMYEKWLELNDVKVGDTMKIIRIPNEFDKGFNCTFHNADRIGETQTVIHTDNEYLCLEYCNVPYFCLEKVETSKQEFNILASDLHYTHGDLNIEVTKDGCDIQEENYSLDSLRKICKAHKLLEGIVDNIALEDGVMLCGADIRNIERVLDHFNK